MMPSRRLAAAVVLGVAVLALGWLAAQGVPEFIHSREMAKAVRTFDGATVRIVYLSANEVPGLQALAESQSIVTTRDVRVAQQLDALAPLDALMFDSAYLSRLDSAWLQERYSQGMVIAGINVGIVDLGALVGERGLDAVWSNPDLTTNFYAMLMHREYPGPDPDRPSAASARAQGELSDERVVGFMLNNLKQLADH